MQAGTRGQRVASNLRSGNVRSEGYLFVARDQKLFIRFASGKTAFPRSLLERRFPIRALFLYDLIDASRQRHRARRLPWLLGMLLLVIWRTDE